MFDEGLDTVPGKVAQQLRCVRQLHVAELLSNCLAKSTGLGLRTDNQSVLWHVPISLCCRVRLNRADERSEAVSAACFDQYFWREPKSANVTSTRYIEDLVRKRNFKHEKETKPTFKN